MKPHPEPARASSRKLSIAHVVDSMEVGGAEKLVATLGRRQKQEGHAVRVTCLYARGPLTAELEECGIETDLVGPGSSYKLFLRLISCFRRTRPEIVHCHNPTAAILSTLPARLAGASVVVDTRHSLVAPPYRVAQELKFWFFARWMNAVVAVSDATRRNLERSPAARPEKIVRIYNGSEPPAYPLVRPEGTTGGFRLVHVARLAPPKNQELLLRAVALAAPRVEGLALAVVGGGPLAGRLKHLAEELGIAGVVTFHGEQKDVAPFLLSADLFVLSSRSEAFPVSLLEAMAHGLPILSTNIGGTPESISPDVGRLVPPGDAEALAEAMVDLSRRRPELRAMGTAARKRYQQLFTTETTFRCYDELYRRFLAE